MDLKRKAIEGALVPVSKKSRNELMTYEGDADTDSQVIMAEWAMHELFYER